MKIKTCLQNPENGRKKTKVTFEGKVKDETVLTFTPFEINFFFFFLPNLQDNDITEAYMCQNKHAACLKYSQCYLSVYIKALKFSFMCHDTGKASSGHGALTSQFS